MESSHIVISSKIEDSIEELKKRYSLNRVVIFNPVDEFKIEDARAVIAEAYISESSLKYLILASNTFNNIAQNALLKLLEEPPRNIAIIIITTSRSSLLPTIQSRLSVVIKKDRVAKEILEINLNDLNDIYNLIKNSNNLKKHQAKALVELILDKAVSSKINLSANQLEAFDLAIRDLELNGRAFNVLAMLLANIVGEKNASLR